MIEFNWSALLELIDSPWLGGVAIGAGLLGWLFGFFKKIGEKFAEGVGKVWGESAAKKVEESVIPLLSRYKLRYLEHLQYRHREFDVKGFAEDGPFALELKNVFVDLSLDPNSIAELSSNPIRPLTPDLTEGRHTVWDYLRDSDQKLAIVGAPGCGKTTLLQHLALTACAGRRSGIASDAVRRTPIFLFLRNHAEEISKNGAYHLPQAARRSVGREGERAPRGWFERRLDRGDPVLGRARALQVA